MKHNLFNLAVVLLLGSAAFAQINNGGGSGGGSGTVSANNGTAGANAFYSAAGGSTTVSPDANLVDNGSTFLAALGLQFTGAQGAATTISTSAANANLILAPNGTGNVTVPAGTLAGTNTQGLLFAGTSVGWAASGGIISQQATSGTNPSYRFYNGTQIQSFITSSATQTALSVATANSTGLLVGAVTTSTTVPAVLLGSEASGVGAFAATSGNQIGVQIGNGTTSGNGALRFAPTSGTANFQFAVVSGQINQTGGANGTITDIFSSVTETALVGPHNLMDLGTGGTGGKFTVTNTGNIKPLLYGSITNCSAVGSAANPSVASCTAAPTGAFSCATASVGNCQVTTTAVTANSNIILQQTSNTAVGTRLGVTCNVTSSVVVPLVTSQTAATSFSFAVTTPVTNPDCFYYWIIN